MNDSAPSEIICVLLDEPEQPPKATAAEMEIAARLKGHRHPGCHEL